MKKKDQHNSKFKELKILSTSLEEIDTGKLKGGFKSLNDVLVSPSSPNSDYCDNMGMCMNHGLCNGNNFNTCINLGHCAQ